VQTIETVRKRLVTEGFEWRWKARTPDTTTAAPNSMASRSQADCHAGGQAPAGYGHWTLQLLADELVALEVVDSISHETVRKTLKKMA